MHVLIVDDHPLYIKGVQALLFELDSSIHTEGACSLAEAFEKLRSTAVDLVLLDLRMPGMKGLEALVCMRAEFPAVPVVVVSADENPEIICKAIELEAAGYIPKDTDQALTIQALQLVLAPGVYIPPHALRMPVHATRSAYHDSARPNLSAKQLAVLKGLLQGKSNKLIARDLNIAEGTVKAHLHGIYEVMGVNTRLKLMIRAHEMKFVDAFPALPSQ
jgi:DNA-binding NarL/FixJ family response regulator